MSRPPWARGLKHAVMNQRDYKERVAPPVGAWIETLFYWFAQQFLIVAPPVGAWIETGTAPTLNSCSPVAPPVGAWIETQR